ncbi:DUF1080 domain-containing protein [Candidatus Sumerlaeota bacterium]|nr:DUF1080 domain-containing protein [Candidatus Sumerlaeota bacterium]
MGEYKGTFTSDRGAPVAAEARVIPLGKRTYRAVVRTGTFLEPDDSPQQPKQKLFIELSGKRRCKVAAFLFGQKLSLQLREKGRTWNGVLREGKLVVEAPVSDGGRFDLALSERRSPTEAAKPPDGAVVLLPYQAGKPTNLDAWTNKNWKIYSDGSVGVFKGRSLTRRMFGDVKLHVEFMCPYEPDGRGQGRGNSGVYLQNYYEVQVLDSFGLPTKDNECGGIYSIAAPKVNASLPPLRWQTYDITFTAPRFGADGKVAKPPTLTVLHNGIKIHDAVPAPRGTEKKTPGGEVKVGPIQLQDHSNPVRYRNIWAVEMRK